MGNPDRQAEEKPLNGDDIDSVDGTVTGYISGDQRTSKERSANHEEMSLRSDHVDGVDSSGPRYQNIHGGCDDIIPGVKGSELIIARDIGQHELCRIPG